MNKLFLAGLLTFIFSLNIHASSTTHCVNVETTRGDSCGTPDSMNVWVTNNCPSMVYVKVCLEKADGNWSCGSDSSLRPGKRNGAFYTCHATRNFEWNSCTGGYSECGFKM
jgi:hypothetical protein